MKSNTRVLPFLKKQLFKLSISLIISLIIALVIMLVPPKKQAELSLNFNLKSEMDILNYLSIFSNRQNSNLETILNLEPTRVNQNRLSCLSNSVENVCPPPLARIRHDKPVSTALGYLSYPRLPSLNNIGQKRRYTKSHERIPRLIHCAHAPAQSVFLSLQDSIRVTG